MIELAPFETENEHLLYCSAANVPFEEGAVGFKVFDDEEKLGLVQLKFVGDAAYVLSLCEIEGQLTCQMLSNVFSAVMEFLGKIQITSVVFPIQTEEHRRIAENNGFDQISPTLYVFDFPDGEQEESDCECHEESCHCHEK